MTTIGIHINGAGFHDKWSEFLAARSVQVKKIDLLAPDVMERVRECDGVMWHFRHEPDDKQLAFPLLHTIGTELGIPVFPDLRTAWHFDNKVAQALLMDACEIPTPKTWTFWREKDAVSWAENASYPVVFKLATGAGSCNVALIRNAEEARDRIRMMFSRSGFVSRGIANPNAGPVRCVARGCRDLLQRFWAVPAYLLFNRYPPLPKHFWMPEKNYALFQEYLPDNSFDTRVTVIGDRAFAFRRMNREGDFRASGSGLIDHDPEGIDSRCTTLAFDAAAKLRMQSVAFDILFQGRGRDPVVVEISYGYLDSAVEQCPGHWDSEKQWHEGRMWPEEAQVIDFLSGLEQAAG